MKKNKVKYIDESLKIRSYVYVESQNEIQINFMDHSHLVIPYSEENLKIVEKLDEYGEGKKEVEPLNALDIVKIVYFFLIGLITIIYSALVSVPFFIGIAAIDTALTCFVVKVIKKASKLREEAKKTRYFLENINDMTGISKTASMSCPKISRRAIKLIEENSYPVEYENLDSYSLKDLIELKKIYVGSKKEDKPKTIGQYRNN